MGGTHPVPELNRVSFLRLPSGEGLPLPARATSGAAGYDLACAEAEVVIPPGGRRLVATGFAVALPMGVEGQVRPRSGLAHRHGITVLNSPGTIDSDYRGEIRVILVNLGSEPVTFQRGERVAQLLFAPFLTPTLVEVDTLPPTGRGEGGFGSTDEAR